MRRARMLVIFETYPLLVSAHQKGTCLDNGLVLGRGGLNV